MSKIRPEIEQLLKNRNEYLSCDEGTSQRFARCTLDRLRRKDREVPALHLSWRHVTTLLNLSTEEARTLIGAGFDVKLETDGPIIKYMEKKYRNRYLVFANGGWCISTEPGGRNIDRLIACPHTTIPTIELEQPVEMLVGLLDAFRTLKEDLKLHGVLPEFIALQEGKEGIFEGLAILEADARQEILRATKAAPTEVPAGRVAAPTRS